MKKLYCFVCCKYRNIEKPKISYLSERKLVHSIICSKCKNDVKNYLKKKSQL